MAIFRRSDAPSSLYGRSDQNRVGVSPTLCIRELAGVLVKKGVAADVGY